MVHFLLGNNLEKISSVNENRMTLNHSHFSKCVELSK